MLGLMNMKVPPFGHKRIDFSDELISQSISGDRDALEELASRCLPHVWRTVYLTCGGSPETDDIVQNAVIDAFAGLPGFRGTGSFAAWLNRITVRAVYRHMRRRSMWMLIPFSDKLDVIPDDFQPGADKRTEDRRLLDHLAAHLKSMKIKNRMPLVLSIVQGYSVIEIADAVGCNVETAKKRLQRGRTELARRLQKDPYCRQIIEEVGR